MMGQMPPIVATACQSNRMALIICHECGAQISDHASTCPKCGAPVLATIQRRQKAVLIQFAIMAGLALVIGLVAWIMITRIFNQAMAPLRDMQQQKQSR